MVEQQNTLAQNCDAEMRFPVDIKYPFFPVKGSGIASEQRCEKSIEGYANLVADKTRTVLYCHNIYCAFYKKEVNGK